MRRCLITMENIDGPGNYSARALKLLNPKLDDLKDLPYSQEKQLIITKEQIDKISIQGVQPKFSAKLNAPGQIFELVEKYGTYIIKPQNPEWHEFPENEAFTMHMAALYKINTPLTGLIKCSDATLSYFIKRFDRLGRGKKCLVEDFSQLAELDRKTKYNYSVEKVIKLIEDYCTFPRIELPKFFRLVLFNFLFGNEDMHLKNYSIMTNAKGVVQLAPAYDLLNSIAAYRYYDKDYSKIEQSALSIKGKKRKLKLDDFIDLASRMQLQQKVVSESFRHLHKCSQQALAILHSSFMSEKMKQVYEEVLKRHETILFK